MTNVGYPAVSAIETALMESVRAGSPDMYEMLATLPTQEGCPSVASKMYLRLVLVSDRR